MKATARVKMLGIMAALLCLVPASAQAVPVEWGSNIVYNSTNWDSSYFTEAPDTSSAGIYGIGYGTVIYDFGNAANLPGQDFNIYEGMGTSEFWALDVYVGVGATYQSAEWYQVDSSQAAPLVFDGYSAYPNDPWGTPLVYSYAVPDFLITFNFIRLVGIDNGGNSNPIFSGFDLNTVGIDPLSAPVPEPSSLLLLGTGILALGLIKRRRRTWSCPGSVDRLGVSCFPL